jgi:hypothetical protein
MLDPQLPSFFRNVVINALAEFAFPGNTVEAGHFAAEFNAPHNVHPLRCGLGGCSRAIGTLLVCH